MKAYRTLRGGNVLENDEVEGEKGDEEITLMDVREAGFGSGRWVGLA